MQVRSGPRHIISPMRKWSITLVLLTLAVTLARTHWRATAQTAAAAPAREETVTFLITFGYLRDGEKDCSGSITANGGAVKKIEGWRFTQGDAVTGPAAWKLRVKA